MVAVAQRNFQNFKYTDDNAVAWTKRGEDEAARAAVDGSTAGAGDPTWINSSRMKVRTITYQDPTTFRTKEVIFYTAAAFAAVALGDIIAFYIEGETGTVNYNAVKKNPERQPARGTARQLADHA